MQHNLYAHNVLLSVVIYIMIASHAVHGFLNQNGHMYSMAYQHTSLYMTDPSNGVPDPLQPPIASLSLSGGGAHGAFQVGCLKALAEENVVKFDSIDTISVGGLIGSFLAQFDIKDQYNGIERLEEIWNTIKTNRNIYKHWKFSFIEGIFVKNGLYNPKPLKKMIHKNLNEKRLTNSDVDFNAATTDISTGDMIVFDKTHADIADAVLAGCSIPVMFPPVKIDGKYFVDAGIKRYFWGTDLDQTVKPIIVITASFNDDAKPLVKKPNGMINYVASVIRIFMDSLYAGDMSRMINRNNVYIIRPEKQLHGDTMSFKNKDIVANINIGYEQTKQMIRDGKLNIKSNGR